MISFELLVTILLIASTTYLTRVLGYFALRNRVLSKRAIAVMEAAPGCVLIAVIAPHFVAKNPADLIALAITIMAAIRLPMLATVVIGVVAAGILRHVFV